MAVPPGRGHGLGETGRTVTRQRILVQVPSFNAGGSENYALRLIRHAGTDAHDWHVTSGNLKKAVLEEAFRDAGATVHHASPGFGQPRQLRAFHQFLRKHRFDAVMTLTGVFGGLTLSVARLAGVPCRIGWHRRATPAYAPTAGRRIYAQTSLRLLDWGATRILSNSRAALDHHHGPGWEQSAKFGVIPNGVDAKRFRPQPERRAKQRAALGIPSEARVIGHVGRLDPAKDHDTLLAVAAQLHMQYSSLRLLLVGSDTESASFTKRLERAGVVGITHALGTRTDIDQLHQAMDVFLFPSITEGQPNALIEAMLSGLPIVASDIPGICEALPPGAGSLLFPARDVSAAAARVAAALADPDAARVPRDWAAARYDLARNLDTALREIAPSHTVPARA